MSIVPVAGVEPEVGRVRSLAERSLREEVVRHLRRDRRLMAGLITLGAVVLVAILAPFIAPNDPLAIDTPNQLREPFWGDPDYRSDLYPLGSDQLGRDLLSRLIWSARIGVAVGILPVAATFLVGSTVGMLSGYFGGWVDAVLMRVVDVTYAFPDLLFIIIIITAARGSGIGDLWSGLALICLAIAVVGWVGMARLMRGQVLTLREREFVLAARAGGASDARIMVRHLLPNAIGPIIVAVAFAVPRAMIAESTLSFLGVGIKPPAPSWGVMIHDGFSAISTSAWPVLLPAACIGVMMLAFTFVGDGLRDALDPLQRT